MSPKLLALVSQWIKNTYGNLFYCNKISLQDKMCTKQGNITAGTSFVLYNHKHYRVHSFLLIRIMRIGSEDVTSFISKELAVLEYFIHRFEQALLGGLLVLQPQLGQDSQPSLSINSDLSSINLLNVQHLCGIDCGPAYVQDSQIEEREKTSAQIWKHNGTPIYIVNTFKL
ncbi:hypothetical protein L873DRAFT_1476526 [Choiromyces venosus 120613-1]|uniref:Uncharacterized protein n=1 Tax=Choiromyces venosus 120613-1 TaxID=1336337 RepID=A0A3N4JA43_9PEZI|nr:hypothetical protein L873DRAFT_1476526 [Choiromyces venosus 120613-1]